MFTRRLMVSLPTVGLALLAVTATAGGTSPAQQLVPSSHRYTLDLSSGTRLYSFDPDRLTDLRGVPTVRLGGSSSNPSQIVTTDNGSVMAAISMKRSHSWPLRAQDLTFRILDVRTGAQRASFHPAVPLWLVDGISPDGSQIFGFSRDEDMTATVEWDAVSAADGHVLHRLHFAESCCDPVLYDPIRQRLYTIDTGYFNSLGVQDTRPRTPVLVAYDLHAGHQVDRLGLRGVLAGSWFPGRQAGGGPVVASWTPGFALSPDGRRLAVLDGQRNTLTLIDALRLRVARTVELRRLESPLERLASWLGLAPDVASAKEFEGTSLEMYFSPDGTHLYVTGLRGHIDRDGRFTGHGLGIRAIDVQRGEIVAEGLPGERLWWTGSSPDGSAVYTITPTVHGDQVEYPFTLRRHDPMTLQIRAERRFTHRPDLLPWIWFLAAP